LSALISTESLASIWISVSELARFVRRASVEVLISYDDELVEVWSDDDGEPFVELQRLVGGATETTQSDGRLALTRRVLRVRYRSQQLVNYAQLQQPRHPVGLYQWRI